MENYIESILMILQIKKIFTNQHLNTSKLFLKNSRHFIDVSFLWFIVKIFI